MSGSLFPLPAARAPWLQARDPRMRLLAALLFALVTLSLERLAAQAAAFLAALVLALTLLPPAGLLRRALPLEGFMVVLLASLPFTVPGHPWLELGPLSASREGLALAVAIALKAGAVVLALAALAGSLEPVVLGHALARLGMPERLVHLLLFTVRYVELLQREYRRLRQAMRARGFAARADRHTWRSLGWLLGMLLVRSLERSRRVLAAMRCRGFDGRLYLLDHPRWRRGDSVALLFLVTLLAGLLALEWGG